MSIFYKLDGHDVIEVSMAEWRHDPEHSRVAKTEIDEVMVSTVFLGVNHNLAFGKPHLFETMVFGGEMDGEMQRYSTWDEALAGHEQIVAAVKGKEVQQCPDAENESR